MFDTKFKITNLNCAACVKLSVDALQSLPGVRSATVDLKTGAVSVESDTELNWEEIKNKLDEIGKNAEK